MISHQEIKNLVAEWGLREDIIEKDHVIEWLLWGISAEPELNGLLPLRENARGQKKIKGKDYACIELLKRSLILDWKASR
jgi:hypothetical protein